MNKERKIKVGVVGLGGRSVAWIQNYLQCPACRITALCDKLDALVQEKNRLVSDRDKNAKVTCYTDYEKMLREADMDAVSLVVAPEYNADLICLALAAGKHVICEVPLCFSIEECRRIVLAVEKSGGLKFQLGEQARFKAFAQAWRTMAQSGALGKILYAQGQYLHGMGPDRFWHDSETGERITWEQAQKVKSHKSRFWNLMHPIRYMPHELSPLLFALDDRVTKVTGVATRTQSYRYEWFPRSDMEIALMHTEKDTIIRLMAGFTTETLVGSEHQYRMVGSEGWVDCQPNAKSGSGGLIWLANGHMSEAANIKWAYNTPWDVPMAARELGVPFSPQAMSSGHGGMDYWPIATFAQAILDDKPVAMDVYRAVETAAPAILAGECMEKGYAWMDVPDFRPGKHQKSG